MPVGFKNGTDGNLGTAIMRCRRASSPYAFMGINQQARPRCCRPRAIRMVIGSCAAGQAPELRLGQCVACAEERRWRRLPGLVVDCSHGNLQQGSPAAVPKVAGQT